MAQRDTTFKVREESEEDHQLAKQAVGLDSGQVIRRRGAAAGVFLGSCRLLLLLLIILLFPDGHVPSPRWRPILWSYLALVALLAGRVYAVAIATLAGHHARVDPGGGLMAIDRPGGGTAWLGTFQPLIFVVLAAFWVSFVVVQARSWRHASGERRQQLKWLMTGAALLAVSQAIVQPILNFVPNLSSGLQQDLNVLLALGAAAVPICIGMAILRYRLYDIDRIISRTLAYAIVTGLLVGV